MQNILITGCWWGIDCIDERRHQTKSYANFRGKH